MMTLCACSVIKGQFQCDQPSQCVSNGAQGVCEPTGYCSFLAPDCPSQQRYGSASPPDLTGQCVMRSAAADATVDSGPDASGFVCPSGALFCDDFEGGLHWDTIDQTPPSKVAIDSTARYHGNSALHASTVIHPAGGDGGSTDAGYIQGHANFTKNFPPRTSGTLAMRFYLLANQAIDQTDIAVWHGSLRNVHVDLYQQFVLWNGSYESPRLGALPVGSWTCVELVLDIGTNGRIRLFVGDTSVPLFDLAQDTSGSYSALDLGLPYVDGGEGIDLYFDDVIVDNALIPCDP